MASNEMWGGGAGSADDDADLASIPSQADLGGGASMTFNPAAFRSLLHHPAVVAALQAKAQRIADTANDIKITEGAEYGVVLQNDPSYTRPRALVKPVGEDPIKAIVDDAAHSTLLKAMGQVGD
jgi:hypothetical protein